MLAEDKQESFIQVSHCLNYLELFSFRQESVIILL